ncbi:acetate--CoA ligase family protein [Nocardia nova]|uniref:acetate--CoA ligase family protein n=1 Tax=Nocardia nova TaxID=37330 RepID=UPI0007A4B9DB|nr:acetate--CoA ligase family protein [Nocardia nova]
MTREYFEESDLTALFCPRNVAVIGASSNHGRALRRGNAGSQILHNLLRAERVSPVFPIHPSAPELGGVPAYGSMGAVPADVDLAVIAVGADSVVPALAEAAAGGARAALIVSSGFAEAGPQGREWQNQLLTVAADFGIRVLGPNCIGFVNPFDRVHATFAFDTRLLPAEPGPVAIVSQSGGLLSHIAAQAAGAGVRFGWLASTGNEADVDVSDTILYLAGRAEVRTILVFCESIRAPERFLEAARVAAELDKPIVLLHGGRTAGATRAVLSHTASISGSARVLEAVCTQFGVRCVSSVTELLDIGRMFQTGKRSNGRRVGVLTPSGGTGVLLADAIESAGLTLPELSPGVQARIRNRMPLPFYGATSNPIDTTANMAADPSCYVDAFRTLMDSDDVDMAVTVAWPGADLDWLIDTAGRSPKPVAVLSTLIPGELGQADVPAYTDAAQIGLALAALADRNRVRPDSAEKVAAEPITRDSFEITPADRQAGTLGEDRTKQLVRRYGIATTHDLLARTRSEALAAAQQLGYPVVLKLVADGIAHKSDIDGVRLALPDAAAVSAAFDEIHDSLRQHAPNTEFGGVLVQEMLTGGSHELIAGFHRDPTFGAVVSIGLGGVSAEVIATTELLRVPFSRDAADHAIRSLAGGRLVGGSRGLTDTHRELLAGILLALGAIGTHYPEIGALDLNPLIVHPKDICAADGFAVLEPRS